MSRRPITAPPRTRFVGRAVLTGGIAVMIAFVGLNAAGREGPADAERVTGAKPEPVLDGRSIAATASGRRQDDGQSRRKRRTPVVVEALAPGQAADPAATSQDEPPERIRQENVRLRRALEDLRALEAERLRVAQALAAAGVPDGGLVLGSGRLIWPLRGPLTSPFGQRWGRLHAGVDISAPSGTPIRAADSGAVVLAGWQGGYGLYTCVRHSSTLSTCYAHQSKLGTSRGASVGKGQVIGFVGNTGQSFGAHLHFETWVRGRPVDPMGFL